MSEPWTLAGGGQGGMQLPAPLSLAKKKIFLNKVRLNEREGGDEKQ